MALVINITKGGGLSNEACCVLLGKTSTYILQTRFLLDLDYLFDLVTIPLH